MKIKEWLVDLKMFFWYLGTEPFRQTKSIVGHFYLAVNKTITWFYIGLVFAIVALFLGNRYVAGIFIIFLLLVILLWEWESGFYKHRYRTVKENKLEKKYNEVEEYDNWRNDK